LFKFIKKRNRSLIGLTLREVPEMNSHAEFKQSNIKELHGSITLTKHVLVGFVKRRALVYITFTNLQISK
jgi:hypothetical protein